MVYASIFWPPTTSVSADLSTCVFLPDWEGSVDSSLGGYGFKLIGLVDAAPRHLLLIRSRLILDYRQVPLQKLRLRDRVLKPRDTRFEDRVCDLDQQAGDGDNDDLVWLAAHFEVLRDRFQNGILTSGGKGGLEKDMSQCTPSSCH